MFKTCCSLDVREVRIIYIRLRLLVQLAYSSACHMVTKRTYRDIHTIFALGYAKPKTVAFMIARLACTVSCNVHVRKLA